jgi:hypothetical protein
MLPIMRATRHEAGRGVSCELGPVARAPQAAMRMTTGGVSPSRCQMLSAPRGVQA